MRPVSAPQSEPQVRIRRMSRLCAWVRRCPLSLWESC